ncbi:hypothetical protein B0T21DRAFT_336195 [Apiosordaria backusii]|uniref:Phospholipase/carboxylesterase/thioesterase domain-containing protein n=1 Tax=Apiosordaria backusii TaxID=314023 RepID=A0AA40EBJ7_9PEZI|nr:hypothetical protein B0T21DRAFT_336195 [Apiosordaria backusii]
MWTLLCQARLDTRLGAVVGTNTWLPFAKNIVKVLGNRGSVSDHNRSESDAFVESMTSAWTTASVPCLLSTPIFLGHGTDDAMVDVQLGRGARDVLSKVGFRVEWKEYSGAELEGHWIKVPEEVDDIVAFLTRSTGTTQAQSTPDRSCFGWPTHPPTAGWPVITLISHICQPPSSAVMDSTERTGPDQLQQSIATSWAGFLAAQYCAREVDAIRKSLNEHIKQTNIQHELLSVAVVQSKSSPDPPPSPLTKISIESHLESLRQEMMESMSQLSQRLTTHEERAENLRSLTSEDIKSLQEKYLSALGMVEYLQGELRDMRSEKIDTENKLMALERQIAALPPPPKTLSDETMIFLNQLFSRRDELIIGANLTDREPVTRVQEGQITGAASHNEIVTIPTNSAGVGNTSITSPATTFTQEKQVKVPNKRKQPNSLSTRHQHGTAIIRKQPKRKAAEPPQTQPNPKRAIPTPPQSLVPANQVKPKTSLSEAQEIKDLYRRFRNRYDTNPPLDQVRGIWRFINQIKNHDVAKHIQESLAQALPEYVKMGSRGRLATQSDPPPRVFVTISGKLTWKRFREHFDHYAALYLKE